MQTGSGKGGELTKDPRCGTIGISGADKKQSQREGNLLHCPYCNQLLHLQPEDPELPAATGADI